MPRAERVLFVHAHPDDETIETGGTIAALIDAGAEVCVLTCTRGERGEVIPDDLKPALQSQSGLAALREKELATAMKILGVSDHRYLGDRNARWSGASDRRYVDSGMSWGKHGAQPAHDHDPQSLTAATFAEVASDIASVIIAVGPDAVVSYDARGGYGHPDHIRARDAARHAADIYRVPFYEVVADDARPAPSVSVDVSHVIDRKRKALAAYRSQLTLEGDEIVFPGGQRRPVGSVESYRFVGSDADAPVAFADQHPFARFATATLAGLIGVCLGALLSVYSQSTGSIAGQKIWIGAIAAIVIAGGVLAGLRLAFGTRVVAAVAAVGMIVAVGALAWFGGGGSVIIPWNGPGITWQIAPTVIAAIVLGWPQGRPSAPGKIGRRSTVVAPEPAPSKGPHQP